MMLLYEETFAVEKKCNICSCSFVVVVVGFFYHSFILHSLDNRTRPLSTLYNGRHQWDSNLHTPASESLYHCAMDDNGLMASRLVALYVYKYTKCIYLQIKIDNNR